MPGTQKMDADHKEAFTKASLRFQENILGLQLRVLEGEMTVENFLDHLQAFEESIKQQDAIQQERRSKYEAMGMDPDEVDR